MNQQNTSSRSGILRFATPRRWTLAGLAAISIGALSVSGISHAGDGPGYGPRHHGMGMHGPIDPANAASRIDRMLERMVPDASPEQKTRISGIAKAALTDLQPLREQHRNAHAEAMKLLSQPSVDRTALEKIRASEIQLADRISKRTMQAMADAAEVLTPEQRAKVAERFQQRRERWQSGKR